MYDLARFTLRDMTECAAALRTLGTGASCLEEVAERIVRYLFTNLGDARTGEKGCALVRFFKTHPYSELDEDYQRFVRDMLGRSPRSPAMKCLTLMATAGERPDWNARSRSRRYKAIPLTGPQFIAQFPMFAQLFKQFGVRLQTDLEPDSDLLMDWDEKTYNVFYVPEAVGSPFVPVQQEFVVSCGIRSVLGFGGILPSGDLFVVVLFSRVHVPRKTAYLFKTLALSVKLALLPFDGKTVFQKTTGDGLGKAVMTSMPHAELQRRRSQVETLEQLLTLHEQAVMTHDTRRKRAEEALQDSEARLLSVVQSTKDAILSINRRGNIAFWNSAAEAMFGYGAKEIVGRPVTVLIPEGFQDLYHQAIQQTNAEGSMGVTGHTSEMVGVRKDGTTFPLELSLTSWKVKSGTLLTGILHDITERKRAEKALQKSEHRFRSLVETARDVIVTLAKDGTITSLNPAFETNMHWAATDWIGKSFAPLLHPEDLPVARELFRYIIEKETSLTCSLRIRTKDNGFIVGEFVGTPQIEDGQVIGVFCIARDITERRAIEDALRDSEEQLRSVVQSTKDAILSIDSHGDITFWNSGAEAMFGYSASEAIGRPVTIIIPERYREAHRQGVARARAAGQLTVTGTMFELVGLRKDETEFPLEFSLAAWKARSGLFFTGIIRDITERKREEEGLRRGAERFQKQQSALITLTQSRTLQSSDLTMTLRHITEVAARTLDVERVSIWRYSDDHRAIHCVDLYELGANRHSSGLELQADSYPAYFHALTTTQIIAADDAHQDPRTSEFATTYLSPLGISSMMDVPISLFGRVTAVICHEHVGPPRRWMQDEQLFAIAISNLIALAHEQWERRRAEEALRCSERELADFFDNATVGLHWVGPDGTILRANKTELDMLGYTREEYVGHHIAEFYVDQEVIGDILRRLSEGETLRSYETQLRRKDGMACHVLIDSNVFRENGVFVHSRWFTRDITERKRMEEALHASEERLRSVVSNIPGAVYRCACDPNWAMEFLSETIQDLCGYPASDFHANQVRTYASVIHPDDRAIVEGAVFSAVEARRPFEVEYRLLHADGSVRHVFERGQGVFDSHGRVHWLDGVIFDVTDRKQTEESLQETRERFSAAFDYAAIGMAIVATDGRFLQVNQSLCRILGYSEQELLSTTFQAITHPEDLSLNLAHRDHMLTGDIPTFHMEKRYLHKLGHIVWAQLSVALVRDPEGEPSYFISQIQDITQRKQVEEELRESEEFSQRMIASSRDCIKVLDLEGRLLWMNERGQQMMGICEFRQVENSRWIEFWSGKDFEEAAQALATAVAGEAGSFQGYCPTLTGEPKWWDVIVTPIRNAQGEVQRLLAVSRDITSRKAAEEQLQNSLSQLRTLSARLEIVREEERARIARELHDELGVGLTCHKIDLSRLSTMMGEALENERRPADGKRDRRKMDDKIRAMIEQVDTTIATVQRIVTELRPGILDDLGLVAAIEWQTQDFQRRTGIDCQFTTDEEDPKVDPERATVIFRIFQEALTNVARHAGATAVIIRLEEQNGALVLDVRDNGRGIPEQKIFDLHSLGLLGMRERAGLFGGDLTITGCQGKGTTITLRLPNPRPA